MPGKYEKIEDTAVFVIGNGVLQMDHAESVTPDGDMVQRDAANNLEHLSKKLFDEKVKQMFNYTLYTTIQLKKPCYPIIATNYDYGKEYEDYVIEGIPLRIYFRIFNEEKIYELLNTVSSIDYNNEELSDSNYIKLINCIVFAKAPYAQDVIENITYMFASIEKIKKNHQLDLHLALKMTIKYHFKGNKKKIKELLTVITKAIDSSKIDAVGEYEVKQFSNEELKSKVSTLKAEKIQLEEENKKQINELEKLKKLLVTHNIPF